jgi:hypothetical protein
VYRVEKACPEEFFIKATAKPGSSIPKVLVLASYIPDRDSSVRAERGL